MAAQTGTSVKLRFTPFAPTCASEVNGCQPRPNVPRSPGFCMNVPSPRRNVGFLELASYCARLPASWWPRDWRLLAGFRIVPCGDIGLTLSTVQPSWQRQ
eukprot:6488609-Amphidinium_carterae.1